MPRHGPTNTHRTPETDEQEAHLVRVMSGFVDAAWYNDRYADVASADLDPVLHFVRFGVAEARDPNPYFDSQWYLTHNQDVAASGINPLLHYLMSGAAELRNPHPRFDAVYYASEHPEAANNPLLFHVRTGAARGFATEKPLDIRDFLPSSQPPLTCPDGISVDVIIPVYRGLEETRRCLQSVLADRAAPLGRILVVEDRSPDADLVAWLKQIARTGAITLLRNKRNLGFVASVNRGMAEAGQHDVVLLNSDTEVPNGWLTRLAAHAYAQPRIASVSPFSNNATICGYPDDQGGPLAFDHDLAALDETCRSVNAGRSIAVPTTVGYCMYIRRAALDQVGAFNAERFHEGYGEENDFCLRATALGWTHRLACDTFVYHEGQVSFGDRKNVLAERARTLLLEDFPDYAERVARHVQLGHVTPFRFTLTAALFRAVNRPVILMVTHDLGGGVRRHIDALVDRFQHKARMLLLEGTDRGVRLSIPALPNHPALVLPADRDDDLLTLLRSFNVSRVHIHHLMGMDINIQKLIRDLNKPFDTTIHDYYPICPQINLLPWRHNIYCGEPDIGACNACIARSHHWARDIVTWRAEHAWIFQDADRVFCPSKDVLNRLKRHHLAERAIFAPHEPVPAGPWPHHVIRPGSGPLRIAILGTLVEHKGSKTVETVIEQADPARFDFHLIGHVDGELSETAQNRLTVTGRYDEADLAATIKNVAPHVIWFPMVWPETYSYTLSAAIESGLPIAATRIGAFEERLQKRPLTWVVDLRTRAEHWISLFEDVRFALKSKRSPNVVRPPVPDIYGAQYLAPRLKRRRRRSRPRIAIVPERFDNGFPTPCAFIRLLQPLSHPAIVGSYEVVVSTIDDISHDTPDIIVTQRFATRDQRSTDKLIEHAQRSGAHLIYDLDDDLLQIPRNHPDAQELRPLARLARTMLQAADTVWVSTPGLASSIATVRHDTVPIENRLDERIWLTEPQSLPSWSGPVRILCMGTATHTHDFALIEPALHRLKTEYGERVSIDVLGMTTAPDLSPGFNRIAPSPHAVRSYAGFVQWLTSVQPSWHIGLAPLQDTAFTRCKSPIKTLDYAAIGLAILASDTPVYRGSIADGVGGVLVPNDSGSWHAALELLLRDRDQRRSLAGEAGEAFRIRGTLLSHATVYRDALNRALGRLPTRNNA